MAKVVPRGVRERISKAEVEFAMGGAIPPASAISTHIVSRTNPHVVTTAQINAVNIGSAEWVDLTDGGDTTLHQHDFEHVTYPESLKIDSPTHISTLQQTLNHMWSAGLVDGGNLTDNGDGTVTLAAGTAVLHATSDPHTDIYSAIIPSGTLTLTDGVANYIYIDYNSGSPAYAVGTAITDFNCIDKCIVYLAHRDGTVVHWIDAREQNVDGNRKTRRLFLDFSKFIHAENGSKLGASGLAITVTAGKFYFMLQEIEHVAFDTSVAGTANANVFTLWNHVASVYTATANSKVIDTTLYDDGTGTATLNNNKYGVTWFYIMNDAPSGLHAVMGQAEYANIQDAAVASPPATLPPILGSLGSLIGYVIYEKSAVAFDDVRSAFSQTFISSAATTHNGLSGLQGGTVAEYYHLTSAEYTGTGTGNFVRATSPTITNCRLDGTVGLSTDALAYVGFNVSSSVALSGNASQFGCSFSPTFGSDCTSYGYGIIASPSTTAASYTMANMRAFQANGFFLEAGSAVTSYAAFYAANETNASNHYSFYGNQGTTNTSDRNCYMAGAAPNYFNGVVLIGSNTDDGTNKLQVTGSAAITASTGVALTVTNTGTGNCLVVNDAAGDTTPFVIDAVGYVGHGITPAFKYDMNLANTAIGANGFQITNTANNLNSAAFRMRKSRGSLGAEAVVSNGDYLGTTHFDGYDGAAYVEAVRVNYRADGAASSGIVPGRIEFLTANSSGTLTESLRITSSQHTIAAGYVKTATYTVATLPTGVAGARAFVTDANATTFASIVAGGGANGVPVYSDGTNWRIG